MPRKLLKYVARILLAVLGVLFLVSILIYLPPVQDFIARQAVGYVEKNMDMELSVEKFRLGFPLNLRLQNTHVLTPQGDTLVRFDELRARAAVWPLLAGRAKLNGVSLTNASVRYADTLSAVTLNGDLAGFTASATFDWKNNRLRIGEASLSGADVELETGESRAPETDSASAPWYITAGRIDLTHVKFRMRNYPPLLRIGADLPSGSLRSAEVDTDRRTVSVRSLELRDGVYSYLTDTVTVPPAAEIVDSLKTPTEPSVWDIAVDRITLTNNAVDYGALYGDPAQGFDPQHIGITALNLGASDFHSRGSLLDLTLENLSGQERSGLCITEGRGGFHTDSTEIRTDGLLLKTAASQIEVTGAIGTRIDEADPQMPVRLDIKSTVGTADLFLFYVPTDALRNALRGRSLTVDGNIGGKLGALTIDDLNVALPGHIRLTADGHLGSVTETEGFSASLRLDGTLTDMDFARELIPDTALRRRIAIPRDIRLNGTIEMAGGRYRPDIAFLIDSGRLNVSGVLDTRSETYTARVTADRLPVGAILPEDSLGLATLELRAEGRGFDPSAEGASSDIGLRIDRFDYRSHGYYNVTVDALLQDHIMDAHIVSRDTSALLDLMGRGELRPDDYEVSLSGRIDSVKLYELGFSADPLTLSLRVDGRAEIKGDNYDITLTIDSALYDNGVRRQNVSSTVIDARASDSGVLATVHSGDLNAEFRSGTSLDSLTAGLSRTVEVLNDEIVARRLDMERIEEIIPPFELTATAGVNNILSEMLRQRGIGFYRANVTARASGGEPFEARVLVNTLETSLLTVDTLNVGMKRRDRELGYYFRLANRPGNIEQMALIYLYGDLVDNTAQVNFYQRNRADSVGFRFGLNAQLGDSLVRATLSPDHPTLGFEEWTVNSDNYVEYHFNKELYADLRLNRGDQHFYLISETGTGLPAGAVRIDVAGLEIGPTLRLLPSPPAVDGTLDADMLFGLPRGSVIARGTASVRDLSYDGRRVGDIGLDLFYLSDPRTGMQVNSAVRLDDRNVLTAKGSYAPSGGGLGVDVTLDGFPLETVNAFLPEDAASVAGTLDGAVNIGGSTASPVLNGELRFSDAVVTVTAIGADFTLDTDRIPIQNNVVRFDDFDIRAANDNPLRLNGQADFSDLSEIYLDLNLRANDFQAMDVARNNRSLLYGQAFMDIDVSARGNIDALRVRGSVRLLTDTNVTYTLGSSDTQIDLQEQEIVTFVSFADTAAIAMADSVRPLRGFRMDALVNIDIDEDVKLTINLSDDGENRASVQGGGSLTYTMNNLGDSRFTGRYELSSGTVYYSPPLMSQKVFNVNEDSYVEWTGELANPTLHITAAETVRAQVTTDNTTRYVNFDIVINLENSLEDLAITFDLAAPGDLTIQNELASMTEEQRSTQAMSLLVYNTYTGPGSTGKVDGSNPLNSFIEKELNQWARNNLKGVDLSIGIDTYDDIGGGSHTDYSYQFSKSLFDDRVTVTIGGKISSDADVDDNLANNFVDDISIEYRFTKRDNMFLKYYRYTTYESILDGEVIKNGVGYVVRKKMTRLSDLFRFSRSIEKRNRRLEREGRRQERREQRRAERRGEESGPEADYGAESVWNDPELLEWMDTLAQLRDLYGEDAWVELIVYEETEETAEDRHE